VCDSTQTVHVLTHVSQRAIYNLYQVSGVVLGTRTPRTQIQVSRCIKSVLYKASGCPEATSLVDHMIYCGIGV